jgi:hypothetical protein
MVFFHQLIFGFPVIRVEGDAVDGTDFLTLRLAVVSHALGAFAGVDLVNLLALRNCAIGALRFAYIAIDAFVGNHQSHINL